MAQMSELTFSLSNQVLVVIGILSTLLSSGLGIGYLPIILSNEINGPNHKRLDEQSLSYLEAAGELAFIASILIIPLTMRKKGRKVANFVTIMPAFLGWILSYNAGKFFSLIIINALHNISLGGAVSISSTLMSEFCSYKYTRIIFMIEIAMISLGILLCHVCNVYSCCTAISLFGIAFSAIGLIVTHFWLDSPYLLVNREQLKRREEMLYELRNQDDDVFDEFGNLFTKRRIQQLVYSKPISMKLRKKITEYCKSLSKADFLKPFSVVLLISSLVSFGGENGITSYSLKHIFKTNGKYIGTIILDVLMLICSLTACGLLQIVKRQSLFLFSSAFTVVIFGLTSVILFLQTLEWISGDCFWLFGLVTGLVMFLSLGTSVIPFSVLGEIFPFSYKGIGSSLTCTYLWALSNSVLRSVPLFCNILGLYGSILITVTILLLVLFVASKLIAESDLQIHSDLDQLVKFRKDERYCISLKETFKTQQSNDTIQVFIEV